MFVDIALKAVIIQLIYAAVVVCGFTIADKKMKKKDKEAEPKCKMN